MTRRCPKCGGYLLADSDRNGKVVADKCFSCSNRIWEGFKVRAPTCVEMEKERDYRQTERADSKSETVVNEWLLKWKRKNDRGRVCIIKNRAELALEKTGSL